MMMPELFRCPVTFESVIETIPPPPEGPRLFGLSEACAKVSIACAIFGEGEKLRDQATLKINAAGIRDDKGVVLSLGLTVHHEDRPISNITLMVAEADARLIASAFDAVIKLTPEPERD